MCPHSFWRLHLGASCALAGGEGIFRLAAELHVKVWRSGFWGLYHEVKWFPETPGLSVCTGVVASTTLAEHVESLPSFIMFSFIDSHFGSRFRLTVHFSR